MDLGSALKRAGRDDITIRSVIANTIKELYNKPVNIISVKIKGNAILIKTGNPMINSELQMIRGDLQNISREKLQKIGITLKPNSIIKFL